MCLSEKLNQATLIHASFHSIKLRGLLDYLYEKPVGLRLSR